MICGLVTETAIEWLAFLAVAALSIKKYQKGLLALPPIDAEQGNFPPQFCVIAFRYIPRSRRPQITSANENDYDQNSKDSRDEDRYENLPKTLISFLVRRPNPDICEYH